MTGTYWHNLDAKGRLAIPSKLRDELGATFYLAMGIDECLAIYPMSTWNKFTEKVSNLPMSQAEDMRSLFACADKCELDAQGRILVSQDLRAYANLGKDVAIIGFNDRAEIWNADTWRARQGGGMTPARMRAIMANLGF